jgi:hypothetical protein
MPRTSPKKTETIDLDAMFGDKLAVNVKTAHYAKVKLGDREWTVTDGGSIMSIIDLMSGDESTAGPAFADYIAGMVVEEERHDFQQMLRRIQGLTAELLMEIANAMQEALADRPTKPSEGSSDKSASPVIETTSRENSSSLAALPSETSTELTL